MGRLLGGIALIMVAAFMTIGMLAGGGAEHGPGVQIFTALIAIGIPGVTGGLLLYRHARGARLVGPSGTDQLRRQTHESEILKLAAARRGRLAVVEIVADTALSVEDAEAALTALVERGVAEVEVTESGLMVYVFPDVQALGEKHESRGLLDA